VADAFLRDVAGIVVEVMQGAEDVIVVAKVCAQACRRCEQACQELLTALG
jgi:Domain of Unknown Function (DUF326)